MQENSFTFNAGISFRGAILDVDVTKEPNVHETVMRVNHLSHVLYSSLLNLFSCLSAYNLSFIHSFIH